MTMIIVQKIVKRIKVKKNVTKKINKATKIITMKSGKAKKIKMMKISKVVHFFQH